MPALKHNKRLNAGLLHESLVRELASAVLSEDRARAAIVLKLIEFGFKQGPLADELAVHQTVLENRGVSKMIAQKIVDEIRVSAFRLDGRSSATTKRALLGEVDRSLGKGLLDRYNVPEYKAHASVNMLIQSASSKRIDEAAQLARVEGYLVEFISTKEPAPKRVDEGASALSYRLALTSYEEQYGKELDQKQRELLSEHVKVSLGGKPHGTKKLLERHRKEIMAAIDKAPSVTGVSTDKVMLERLGEARRELYDMELDVNVETMERLMLFHDLRRQIES